MEKNNFNKIEINALRSKIDDMESMVDNSILKIEDVMLGVGAAVIAFMFFYVTMGLAMGVFFSIIAFGWYVYPLYESKQIAENIKKTFLQ